MTGETPSTPPETETPNDVYRRELAELEREYEADIQDLEESYKDAKILLALDHKEESSTAVAYLDGAGALDMPRLTRVSKWLKEFREGSET